MNKFIRSIKEKAKQDKKTIILPETKDKRILDAAEIILKEDFANLVLIGNPDEIKAMAPEKDLSKAKIVDPLNFEKMDQYVASFFEMRKHKGITQDKAKEYMKNSMYFATMMVKLGEADGLVAGATHSTADTLRPALQIIKTKPTANSVSTFSIMVLPDCKYKEDGIYFFADTGLIENPNKEELAEIAIQTSESYKEIMGETPRVAMLSYSTYGSAISPETEKVHHATEIVKQRVPKLCIDGEMQLDAAVVDSIGKFKAPGSEVAGRANILIFPDLNAANIGYKLTERFGNADAYGPITQGLAAPVNDLSRGCKAEDIVGAVAITCLQAQQ